MQNRLTKTIIGAVIAIALAAAVSYGLITQQTADQIQTQANQTLSNDQTSPPSAPQQPSPVPQGSTPPPTQPGADRQSPAPATRP